MELIESFFEEPNRIFMLRELSRITKIPKSTVERNLKLLLKEKLIIKKEMKGYIANEESPEYKFRKKIFAIEKIHKSKILEYLEDTFLPRTVILFGSFSKGEYTKSSDIDIFIQSTETKYNTEKYEKILKHDINIVFEEDLNKLSSELFNNIINGVKLYGYIKIK